MCIRDSWNTACSMQPAAEPSIQHPCCSIQHHHMFSCHALAPRVRNKARTRWAEEGRHSGNKVLELLVAVLLICSEAALDRDWRGP
eukprot:808075-Rhodomonas_salina.4